MHASSGILFNHESPRRGETFVTRKITRGLSKICFGLQDCLYLGNLNAKRDWGHAKDFVDAMWLMLQQDKPDDYVISTGSQYSVRDFVNAATKAAGLEIAWEGKGLNEKAVVKNITNLDHIKVNIGDTIVRVSQEYFRPSEVETLLGDSTKAYNKLGWNPNITFEELVQTMMLNDMQMAKNEQLIISNKSN